MTNPKHLLFDFYLNILKIPSTDKFRLHNQQLYCSVLYAVSKAIQEDAETVQRIFEAMAKEDLK